MFGFLGKTKVFGFVICRWPMAGFGQYCTNLKIAMMELKNLKLEDSKKNYKIVEHINFSEPWYKQYKI
jgi:hypothetical protein